MPDRLDPGGTALLFKTSQGERSRAREIAHAMLVMNRERVARFARDVARAAANVEDPVASIRRLRRTAGRAATAIASTRSDSTWIAGIRRGQVDGSLVRVARAATPGRLAHRASRAPAPRADRAHRPVPARQLRRTGRQRGQRQQVEAIVLEHRRQRTRVAGPDELKVALRNLEAGHVAVTAMPEQLPFERAEGTA